MLHASNQAPPTPVPNPSASTTTVGSMPHMPINENIWTQPKPSIPIAQPHSLPGMTLNNLYELLKFKVNYFYYIFKFS